MKVPSRRTINNEIEDAEARMLKDSGQRDSTDVSLVKTKDSLKTVRKWNQVYHPYMKEIQMRVIAERANNVSAVLICTKQLSRRL